MWSRRALLLAALGGLAACAERKDFEYTPASEIPPGPGLFSGEDGEYTIYRDNIGGGRRRRGTAPERVPDGPQN